LELYRTDAPALFALLETLRSRLKTPRVHHVLLVGAHNAAVVQLPRLGVFGWQRNYLLIGLPLMQSVSPKEFDAVLAPYHDVGMTAIKVAAFGRGVNVTLGLPFPRTSPDHGTAFDIAGTGRADPSSMRQALELAAELAGRTMAAREARSASAG
jgi:hypothetical protein